jgi:hypothetical protein
MVQQGEYSATGKPNNSGYTRIYGWYIGAINSNCMVFGLYVILNTNRSEWVDDKWRNYYTFPGIPVDEYKHAVTH